MAVPRSSLAGASGGADLPDDVGDSWAPIGAGDAITHDEGTADDDGTGHGDGSSSAAAELTDIAAHSGAVLASSHTADTTDDSPGVAVRSHDVPDDRRTAAPTVQDNLDSVGFGRFQLKLLVVCGMGWWVDAMWEQVVPIALPQLTATFDGHIDPALIGIFMSGQFIGMSAGSVVWGSIADSYGRLVTFRTMMVVSGVAGCACAFAPSWWLLALLLVIVGFGIGGALPCDGALFCEYSPSKNRGRYLATLSMFYSTGSVFTSLVGYIVIPANDVDTGWRILCGFLGVCTLVSQLFRLRYKETPVFLFNDGNVGEAEAVLRSIADENGNPLGLMLPLSRDGPRRGLADRKRAGSVGLLEAVRRRSSVGAGVVLEIPSNEDAADAAAAATSGSPQPVVGDSAVAAEYSPPQLLDDDDTPSVKANGASGSGGGGGEGEGGEGGGKIEDDAADRVNDTVDAQSDSSRRPSVASGEGGDGDSAGSGDDTRDASEKNGGGRVSPMLETYAPDAAGSPVAMQRRKEQDSLMTVIFSSKELTKTALLLWAAWFLGLVGYVGINTFLPVLLKRRGVDSSDSLYEDALIYSATGLVGAAAGTYMVETGAGRKGTMWGSTAVATVCVLLASATQSPFWTMFLSSLANCAFQMMFAALSTFTPEAFPTRVRASATGIANMSARLAGMVSPMVVGPLLAESDALALGVCGAALVMAVVCMYNLPFETRGRPLDD